MNATWLRRHQRTTFLVASGLSTAGSFAGITAKSWILIDGSNNPLLLALHFGALALPALVVSGPAGVLTDRMGSESMLIRAQWGLFAAGVLGALAIPISNGHLHLEMALLLLSTLLVGIASTYEITARSKYCALLVDQAEQLPPYLASFSVVFNVGKLVGPPLGGALLALGGATTALALDAATYLLPIATIIWLLSPNRSAEERSGGPGATTGLREAWSSSGPVLRHVLQFTAVACLAVFFHPALAPVMARQVLDGSPQALGTFTAVLAAGSISGGVVLQRNSLWLSQRPGLLLGGCTVVTGLAQLGMASSQSRLAGLAATFVIGAGTAGLLAGANLIGQVAAPQRIRGRMAGMSQIAFLGGGGVSGLMAAALTMVWGLKPTLGLLGAIGIGLGLLELLQRGRTRLPAAPLKSA